MRNLFQLTLLLAFFSVNLLCAQKKDMDKIDYLLKMSRQQLYYDGLKSLDDSKQASLLAEKTGNSEYKAKAYLSIGKSLYNLDMYKESLIYLDKGLNEKATKNNVILTESLKAFKASNHYVLLLFDQAFAEYNDVVKALEGNSDPEAIRIVAMAYTGISAIYSYRMDNNKADQYIDKAISIYHKIPKDKFDKFDSFEISDFCMGKGFVFLGKNEYDSAHYYISKSYLMVANDTLYPNYRQLSALGTYYYLTKQFSQSLKYHLEAIKDIEKFNVKNADYQTNLYRETSELYKILGDTKNQSLYYDKYHEADLKYRKENTESIQLAVNNILNNESEKINYENNKMLLLFSLMIFVLLGLMVFFCVIYLRTNKKRKKILKELEEKSFILTVKEEQTMELKQKINETFDEIINIAKINHPNFYTRFLEVYPNFQKKLLSIQPNLQNSELQLLAYIYLNFQTKEIADFTFKSVKTIQNRKHNLRKKLDIPTSEDMHVWLKSVCV